MTMAKRKPPPRPRITPRPTSRELPRTRSTYQRTLPSTWTPTHLNIPVCRANSRVSATLTEDARAGRRKVTRLLFIARSCPALAVEAYTQALREIQEHTLDVELYESVVTEFNNRPEASSRHYALDDAWAERTRRHVADQQDKLDVELKNYQTNLIKESIRVRLLAVAV